MEQQPSSSSSPSSQRGGGRELQGPRPAPLKVRKDSHKIRKPPQPPGQVRQPVIIYTVSPKVVHAEPSEFMSVVQRLTGAPPPPGASSSSLQAAAELAGTTHQPSSLPFPFYGHPNHSSSAAAPPQLQFPFPFQLQQQQGPHELSPAARLAAIQQASSVATARSGGGAGAGGGLPPLSSILSPVPGALPAIPASFFSPPAGAGDAGGGINLFGELINPAFLGATTTTSAAAGGASQSYPMLLPSPPGAYYYWDLFNNHQNL